MRSQTLLTVHVPPITDAVRNVKIHKEGPFPKMWNTARECTHTQSHKSIIFGHSPNWYKRKIQIPQDKCLGKERITVDQKNKRPLNIRHMPGTTDTWVSNRREKGRTVAS